MGPRFLKIAVLYLIIGIGVGIYMSSSIQLQWASAHAHVNLAGWATTAIMGLVYCVYPHAGRNTLAVVHFWTYNIGLPLFLVSTFMVQIPDMLGFAHNFTFIGAGLMAVGLLSFVANLYMNIKETD